MSKKEIKGTPLRVIFVGMHNKADKMPLCPSTKSGKLIARITAELKSVKCLRTNLYDVEYYPVTNSEKYTLAKDWYERIEPQAQDIIVLLGQEVHDNFIPTCPNLIKIAHPSSKRSHEAMDGYVLDALSKINHFIPSPNTPTTKK